MNEISVKLWAKTDATSKNGILYYFICGRISSGACFMG